MVNFVLPICVIVLKRGRKYTKKRPSMAQILRYSQERTGKTEQNSITENFSYIGSVPGANDVRR